MYRQVVPPNLNQTGKPGFCLGLVLRAFGFPYGAEYARAEWDRNTTKHTDALPTDVCVPVFYSWVGTIDGITRDWGDVAIYVPGRGVFGSPIRGGVANRWDPNVEARRIAIGNNATYLGWTESLNGVNLIQGDNMTGQQAAEGALYVRLLGFESVDQANSHNVDDVQHIMADPAYLGAIAKQVYLGEWQNPAWKAANYDRLVGELQKAKALSDELMQRPTKENLAALQTQINACIENQDKLVEEKAESVKTGNAILRFIADWWNGRKK